MITGNNSLFVRLWHEVSVKRIGLCFTSREQAKISELKWFPYQKGGEFRKWYGNHEYVVDWENDGFKLKNTKDIYGKVPAHAFNEEYIFQPNVNWSAITISFFSARITPCGSLFDAGGSAAFSGSLEKTLELCGFLNSIVTRECLLAINPTLNFQAWNIGNLPVNDDSIGGVVYSNVEKLYELSKNDWDDFETSWDFKRDKLLIINESLMARSYRRLLEVACENIKIVNSLENDNNIILISSYLNDDKYNSGVPLRQISLWMNICYRYSQDEPQPESYDRLQSDTLAELLSYAIGCMMGRYSLDREGLVYAHAGNKGFAELVADGAYQSFPADGDGILPLMDSAWFEDDITTRVREFVRCVWGEEHLQENLDFIAESLRLYAVKEKRGESATNTIRRYFSTQFWKDHLKTYKKRPIYWLFSSGKEKAFECLVYLHRYNESTLARMRTEYVVPLLARYQSNIDLLVERGQNAASTAEKTALKKEETALTRKFNELRSFDDRLRHYADKRISIDLDDGVKVNYGKFGDLLADVKAITGNKAQED